MQIKCDYCGNLIDDSLEKCPYCGAPSNSMSRAANGVPQTIEELKAFCAAHSIDLGKLHFHIGENYTGARAYGIYRDDDGNYIVYKNKSDGSRIVRYRGKDEDYAVNELYQKLKAQVNELKARSAAPQPSRSTPKPRYSASTDSSVYRNYSKKKKRKVIIRRIILALVILLMLSSCIAAMLDDEPSGSSSGGSGSYGGSGYYYSYDSGSDYGYDSGYSYNYDDNDSWDWSWDDDDDWDYDWDDDDWDYDWDSDWDSDWGWDDDW